MILTNGKTSVGIDAIGGNITSYQYNGKHIFYPHQMVWENDVLKERGRGHDCFPNFGTAHFDPKYALSQHGIIRNVHMECIFGEKDLDPHDETPDIKDKTCPYFLGRYTHTANNVFPFNFLYESYIMVHSEKFFKRIKVRRNPGGLSEKMPYSYGFHPYFCTKGYTMVSTQKSRLLQIEHHDFPEDKVIFLPHDDTSSQTVVVACAGVGITDMEIGGFKEKNINLVIWRGHSEYICIEPVTGKYYSNTEKGLFLDVDEEFEIWFEFSFRPFS